MLRQRAVRRGEATCPLCRDSLQDVDLDTTTCPACGTTYHGACFDELGERGCPTLGCGGARAEATASGPAWPELRASPWLRRLGVLGFALYAVALPAMFSGVEWVGTVGMALTPVAIYSHFAALIVWGLQAQSTASEWVVLRGRRRERPDGSTVDWRVAPCDGWVYRVPWERPYLLDRGVQSLRYTIPGVTFRGDAERDLGVEVEWRFPDAPLALGPTVQRFCGDNLPPGPNQTQELRRRAEQVVAEETALAVRRWGGAANPPRSDEAPEALRRAVATRLTRAGVDLLSLNLRSLAADDLKKP